MCSTLVNARPPTAEETYASVQRMIHKLVHQHQTRCGGEYEELLAEANLYFVRAYNTWEESKGKITTHVWHSVRNGLKNICRTKSERRFAQHAELSQNIPERSGFDLRAFLNDLGDDAKNVVEIILESPIDFIQLLRGMGENAEQKISTKRKALTRFLRDKGWSANKISRTFGQVKEALA